MPKAKPKTIKKKKVDVHENCLVIENLADVTKQVGELMKEKEYNPGAVQDEDAGLVFIEGEPNMVLDNKYVPHEEAKIVFKTRAIVRMYLELQNLKNKKKKNE